VRTIRPVCRLAAAVLLGRIAAGAPARADDAALATAWRPLEAGLELGTFALAREADCGDSRARVLRVDPVYYDLRLIMVSASADSQPRTAREWCFREGLVAAINAAMYQSDARTGTSLMLTRRHTNNGRVTRDNSLLVFDPLEPGIPPVRILDRTCDDWAGLRARYGTQIQGIRMIACDGRNTWSEQPKRWSAAAIGTDGRGRVLLIHVRSPYSMHELIDLLGELPLDLTRLQYAEGGPEAQLYARGGGEEYEFVGSYETGFFEEDGNTLALPVPNVIGVVAR
jgi:hypothetical protein